MGALQEFNETKADFIEDIDKSTCELEKNVLKKTAMETKVHSVHFVCCDVI